MIKKYRRHILTFIILVLIFAGWLIFFARGPLQENISWGVTFSVPQAEGLGLDWRETYLALLDDLGIRQFRLVAEWDRMEPKAGEYDFSSLDWQLSELEKRGGKALVVIGMKVPRWPECH